MKISKLYVLIIGSLLMYFLVYVCTLTGCACLSYEPGGKVIVHNNTNIVLKIYLDEEVFLGDVYPETGANWTIDIYRSNKITAKDETGTVRYFKEWSEEDLSDNRIIDIYFPPKADEKDS